MSDNELLNRYRKSRSEPAFSALVARYVNLVYSTASRHVSSADLAKEVTQRVFIELAKQPSKLPRNVHLGSWLYVVTRRRAIDLIRSERTRMKHEAKAAAEQTAPGQTRDPDWESIRPALDDALGDLGDGEREAVIRRFFEGQGYRDIGVALGIAEDTAQKRVSRALDRLKGSLSRRGVTSSAAMVAAALQAHAVEPAPAGLAPSVTSGSAPAILAAAHQGIASIVGRCVLPAAALATAASLLYLTRVRAAQQSEIAELRRQLAEAKDQVEPSTNAIANLPRTDAPGGKSSAKPEDPRVQVLAQRIHRLKDWLVQFPEDGSPEMSLLTYVDWVVVVDDEPNLDNFGASQSAMITQENAIRGALMLLDQVASRKLQPALNAAYRRYRLATGRTTLDNVRDLIPFLEAPAEPSFLEEYSIYAPGSGANGPALKVQRNNGFWTLGLSASP